MNQENKEQLVENFTREIERCAVLEQEEKNYWIQSAGDLPETLLEYMYGYFKEKNDVIDSYVSKALEEDPGLVTEMKTDVQKLKRHILQFKEKQETNEENAEAKLMKEIKNI